MLRCNVSRGIHRRMKTVGRYDPCDFWPPPCVPAWTALDSFRGQNTDFTIYFIISSISMLASLQLSSHSYTPTKSCTCFLLPMCITQAVLHAPRLKGMYGTLERSKTSRRTKCSGSGSEGNSRVPAYWTYSLVSCLNWASVCGTCVCVERRRKEGSIIDRC